MKAESQQQKLNLWGE